MVATAPTRSYGMPSVFANSMRAELRKLFTVRSTYATLLLAALFNVLLAAAAAIVLPDRLSAEDRQTIDSIRLSLSGLHLSQIAFGVLGVLVITGEYSTGLIRATLAAVPRRRTMLLTKVLVFALTAVVAGTASCFAAYYVFQAFLSGDTMASAITDPGVLRAVIGGGLFLTAVGLFGLGLGAVIRSSAGAIATLFGILFVPLILINLLPEEWKTTLNPYLPMSAGEQIFIVNQEPGMLDPWDAFGVFGIYVGIALVLGFFQIRHRDA